MRLALVPILAAMALWPPSELTGSWTLLSVENVHADGTRVRPYGPDPVGRMTLDADGRYTVQIFTRSRPRFASNDKNRGTPEENLSLVRGTNSHFGRYEVADGTITFRIDHASFPNWEGTTQRRTYLVRGDTLRYSVTTTTSGGSEVAEVSWVRER